MLWYTLTTYLQWPVKRGVTGFCEDLNHLVPINNLGELRWYAGCHYSRDKVVGLLTISQTSFTEKMVNQFGVTAGRNTPLSTEAFLGEFDEDKRDGV